MKNDNSHQSPTYNYDPMNQKSELFCSFTQADFDTDEIKLIEGALLATKALFDLTEKQKSAVKMKAFYNRGWDNSQSSDVAEHKAYRESFVFGLDNETSDLKNIWPEELNEQHRATLMDFLSFSISLCVEWYCKNACILDFKFSQDAFLHRIHSSDLRVKAAAYFPVEEIALPQTGCFEHEDYGLFTINFSNKCSDLFAYIDGKWINSEKEAIANLWSGGQIEYCSDSFVPTKHKIILGDKATRYSLNLFIEV